MEQTICAICAWRADCQKKFSMSGRDMRCIDFVKIFLLRRRNRKERKRVRLKRNNIFIQLVVLLVRNSASWCHSQAELISSVSSSEVKAFCPSLSDAPSNTCSWIKDPPDTVSSGRIAGLQEYQLPEIPWALGVPTGLSTEILQEFLCCTVHKRPARNFLSSENFHKSSIKQCLHYAIGINPLIASISAFMIGCL